MLGVPLDGLGEDPALDVLPLALQGEVRYFFNIVFINFKIAIAACIDFYSLGRKSVV